MSKKTPLFSGRPSVRFCLCVTIALLLSLLSISLSGCKAASPPLNPDNISAKESTAPSGTAAYRGWANILQQGHSDYGVNTLSPEGQVIYRDVEQAVLEYRNVIKTIDAESDIISKVLLYLRHDYPLLDWIEGKYTYRRLLDGRMEITLTYSKTDEEIKQELLKLQAAGDEICNKISPSLTDFDKALLCHDALLAGVVYDLNSTRGSDAAGALLDNSATCTGYAKAYQYLLCRLSIDALIVYGEANEPHSWNMIKLDDSYYLADPTWNDRGDDTISFVSHEYIFLDDASMAKTHTVTQGDSNYPLPVCDKSDMIYLSRKGLVAKSSAEEELTAVYSRALDFALADKSIAITVAFSNETVYNEVTKALPTGKLDSLLRSLCEARDCGTVVGRIVNENLYCLTYLLGKN